MSRTIRQYIKQRMVWCLAFMIGGWIVIAFGAQIARQLPDGPIRALFPLIGFAVFGGGIIALRRAVKCPKCKARLGQTIAMPLTLSWGSGPKVNFCPYCGVSLDDPLPQPEQLAPSQNPIHPA